MNLSLFLLVLLLSGCLAKQEVEVQGHCRAEGTGATSCEIDTSAEREIEI